MPALVLIFPELNTFCEETTPRDLVAITPKKMKQISKETADNRSLNATTIHSLPFSIDRENQEITLQMKCPIGNGDLDEQLRVAAQSLEVSLHLAADQISALVAPERRLITKTELPVIKHSRKSKQKKTRKSLQAH